MNYYKLVHDEDQKDPRLNYQLCAMIDQTCNDPKAKLAYYEKFIEKYGTKQRFFSETVAKRISELKEEIHLAGD